MAVRPNLKAHRATVAKIAKRLKQAAYDVAYEIATRSKPPWGYRTLTQQEELPLLRDHLLRLDAESRHDRFNGFLDDSFIESYAARCPWSATRRPRVRPLPAQNPPEIRGGFALGDRVAG
jgi:hypothetical protein